MTGSEKFNKSVSFYVLKQGSQTQSDSRAAWDSKKGLEGHIKKSLKNVPKIFS